MVHADFINTNFLKCNDMRVLNGIIDVLFYNGIQPLVLFVQIFFDLVFFDTL